MLQVVLQQRVERGGQQVLVQEFIGISIGAHVRLRLSLLMSYMAHLRPFCMLTAATEDCISHHKGSLRENLRC
jgi:hypothetical protein